MLPINKKNGPCDPISSNCVIWQGPDLPCVDICNGDSISAVIAGLCDQLVILQNGSGGGIHIDQINQTTLNGGPATTETELIQLIINNISNSGGSGSGGGGIWSCKDTYECTLGVPECLTSITNDLTNPDSLESILTYLMNQECSEAQHRGALTNSIQQAVTDVAAVKAQPKGDPNPTLQSVYVDKGNTAQQPVAVVLNKVEVAYGHTADAVGTDVNVASALAVTPTNALPLDQPITKRIGFVPALDQNPTSLAQSLATAMRLIADLRGAVEKLQIDSGTNGILSRMVDINTFYALGSSCVQAVTNAGTSSNCVDLWNETGVQFDTTVRAYSAPVGESSYELTTNSWHAVCPGTALVAQYLGGASGTNTAPFWSTPTTGCGG